MRRQNSATMTSRRAAFGLIAGIACTVCGAAAVGQSMDRVKLLDRKEVSGEIAGVSPNDVEIQDSRGELVRVPVDRIREVWLAGEPDSLRNARGMLMRQDAAAALDELEKVTQDELDGASNLVLADMAFVRAAASGRVAAASGADVPAAEKGLRAFLQAHPTSHQSYAAMEALAALLAAGGRYDDAAATLAPLGKGPPSLRVRAAAAKGRLYYDQGKFADALREFEAAERTETDPTDTASVRQKAEATLGRARCLARTGKGAEAVAVITKLVEGAGSEDADLLALAYAALGDAHAGTDGRREDAIIAFVRVDLVYNSVPDAHAEALFNLVGLWDNARNPERSRQVRQALEVTYPDSRWARKLAQGPGGK